MPLAEPPILAAEEVTVSWTRTRALLIIVAGAAAPACGGDGDGDDTGAAPHVEEQDTTPPTLLSVSPEDGATGLPADTVVTLEFSEPMDPGNVSSTLATQDLGEVQLEWNERGDTLTIAPRNPLAYAEGEDPAEVDALTYTVILGSAATDLAGNALGPGVQVTFATLKRITTKLKWDDALSGAIHSDSIVDEPLSDKFQVGDTPEDEAVRTVFTFDLGSLPEDAAEIESAHLLTELAVQLGFPFDGLGGAVLLDHVSYDGIDTDLKINAAFNTSQAPHANLGPFANAETDLVSHDVTNAVVEDLEQRGRSQYLLRFDTLTDLDGEADLITLYDGETALELVYLTP